jgi:uncharacterized RDD family membrane protein YckC
MTARVNPIPQEARVFQGRRAGLVTRLAATCVDIGIVVIALIVIYLGAVAVVFIVPPGGFQMPPPPLWLTLVAGPLAMTLYLAGWWHASGRTYGGHVMGLRVMDRRGRIPSLMTALLRAALNVACPLGLLWVVVSRQNRSIQDVVLGTSVVYDWDMRPRVRSGEAGIGPRTGLDGKQVGRLANQVVRGDEGVAGTDVAGAQPDVAPVEPRPG